MRQINVQVSDSSYKSVKIAVANSGMSLKRWVERAIVQTAEKEGVKTKTESDQETAKSDPSVGQRTYVPFDEA